MCVFVFMPTDSVEDGEKIVNTALDKFGRIGETFVTTVLH